MLVVAAAQLPLLASQSPRRDPPRPPKALAAILRSRVIACLRAQDGETAMQAAHAAVRGGVSVVVEDLRKSYPSLTFGVGTVLNADDARKAIRAGAQFLMSPGTVMEILHDLDGSEVLYIPGVLTPTEVYPVSAIGGEMYMSALKKPFPLVPMVASQGITIGSIKSYMEAGASAVVLSDAIFDKELMRERDFIGISALANQATLQASQCGR
uniref:KHG/KDPG aldolase n=1 Tax=Aegilops tauschii TaxID=37682 RepID=M8AR35_AEGTA